MINLPNAPFYEHPKKATFEKQRIHPRPAIAVSIRKIYLFIIVSMSLMVLACRDPIVSIHNSDVEVALDTGYIVPPAQIKPPTWITLKKPRISILNKPIIHEEKVWNKSIKADRSFELIRKSKIELTPNLSNYPKVTTIESKPVSAERPKVLLPKNIITKKEDIVSFQLENVGTSNGLFQDRGGALWGCSRFGGIWKYDGINFSYYSLEQGLIDDSVLDMVFDRFGNQWIGTSTGLVKFDGQTFTNYIGENEVSRNKPTKIVEDANGNIWVGSIDGLYYIDQTKQTITHLTQENGLIQNEISAMVLDQSGKLWMTYNHAGISRLTIQTDQGHPTFLIENYLDEEAKNVTLVQSLFADQKGNLYVGSSGELLLLKTNNTSTDTILNGLYFSGHTIGTGWIYDITQDQLGRIWIAGRADIMIFNQPDPQISDHLEINIDSEQYKGFAYAILMDSANHIWTSTGEAQIDKIKINQSLQTIKKRFGIAVYSTHVVQDQNHNIWFVNPNEGLFCLKRDSVKQTEILLEYPFNQDFVATSYFTIDLKGNIWMSAFGELMKIILDQSDGTGQVQHFGKEEGLRISGIYDIQIDRAGNPWVANNTLSLFDKNRISKGGGVFQLKGDTLYQYGKEQGLLAPDTYQIGYDKQGIFWFNSLYYGITKYAPKTEYRNAIWTHYSGGRIFPSNHFGFQTHARNGVIVNTTKGSLHLYSENDGAQNRVNLFPLEMNKNYESFSYFFEDSKGYIWYANGKEVNRSRYSSEGLFFEGFNFRDDIEEVSVSSKWPLEMFESFDGRVWVLAKGDLTSFHPNDVKLPLKTKETYFRNVQVSGQDINWNELANLNLPYDNNDLEFEYHAIEIDKPDKVEYRYYLDGNQNDWGKPTKGTTITYPNLAPGKYLLKVSSRIKPGPWGPSLEYPFTIQPPWWKTWLAFGLYALLFISTLATAWRWQLKRMKEKNLIEKRISDAEKIQELDEARTEFFTNLSHEFRTPLTVMIGMTNELDEDQSPKSKIKQSAQNLLKLVNQMLDFSKLEAGRLTLDLASGDLVHYVAYQLHNFHSLANYKSIQLSFESQLESLIMDFDESKIQHIISNLLSNAIKFTPSGGKVKLSIYEDDHHVTIEVKDSGIGVDQNKVPQIFERYFQVKDKISKGSPGTGIGLSFSKDLVELMHGRIEVESEKAKGSTFKVVLPKLNVQNIDYKTTEQTSKNLNLQYANVPLKAFNEHQLEEKGKSELPRLLVIEDNPQIVVYIKKILGPDYDLIIAEDGVVGIEKAIQLIPDIILSDVMMPFKDGFEVTDTLKNDERTSHIPIILLTAKADLDSRLEGLKRGADAYLAKPFDKNELMIRLQNMVEVCKKYRIKYAQSAKIPSKDKLTLDHAEPVKDLENVFLQKVNALIDRNMDNAGFLVDELSSEVGMSRSQLYRKLKALTGQSTVAYLRSRRLHEAKRLLLQNEMNVSEIAYEVGFSTPSYFSKVFSDEFGQAPTDITNKS